MARKTVVIGLDGLEPTIVDGLFTRGELPTLWRLRERGGAARLRTTTPAQTPVAWSSFATGTNPGGHGIFDFLRRDPATYLPDLSLNRYEQKNAFVPPKVVNLRRGTAFWELLSRSGIPSVVLRCPCTYPPDRIKGRMLSGMGVPDVRGGLGTGVWYTSGVDVEAKESELVISITLDARGAAQSVLVGPRNPKTGTDVTLGLGLSVDRGARTITLRPEGQERGIVLREGQWSDWVRLKFRLGMLQSVSGMQRFLLVRTDPVLELYASPVNYDPDAPPFPISSPWEYATELRREIGAFYTTGMVEDHTALSNGRIDEAAYLAQCDLVFQEREAMLRVELERMREGFLFCLFDTPDRIQHMFWRFLEPGHPANRGEDVGEYRHVIADYYRRCDAMLGRVLERLGDDDFLIVLSDHGFNTFQRGVHVNAWLHANGLLALRSGMEIGAESPDLLQAIDWDRTKAYALGLGGIYLNLADREANGTVQAHDAEPLARAIRSGLAGLVDTERGQVAVRSVSLREEVYSGPYAAESPDLMVNFAAGYRASWSTATGGVGKGLFEDNVKRWSGDHIIDPSLVPGVLFMNQPFLEADPHLVDLAPTILASFGLEPGEQMEGRALLRVPLAVPV